MPPIAVRTPLASYADHVHKWSGGCGSSLCAGAFMRCFARGREEGHPPAIPCDVLFIGEAPGISEDTLGEPFVGPAGKMMGRIVNEAVPYDLPVAMTNLVMCMPRDDEGSKAVAPPKEAIESCRPRLKELVRILQPLVIVLVGTHAKKAIAGQADFSSRKDGGLEWIVDGRFLEFASITHPGAILPGRSDKGTTIMEVKRSVVAIRGAIERMSRRG